MIVPKKLSSAPAPAFNLLLLLGAGTGLIYILRWFWWRINASTEIVAMIASLIVATYFSFINDHGLQDWQTIIIGTSITTVVWIIATFFTPQTNEETLLKFIQKIRPGGNGWNKIINLAKEKGIEIPNDRGNLPLEILCVVIACISVYSILFCVGNWIYGNGTLALILGIVAAAGTWFLFTAWKKLKI